MIAVVILRIGEIAVDVPGWGWLFALFVGLPGYGYARSKND